MNSSQVKHPNFFLVGGPKCGTTSLAAYLATHPAVYISDLKEPYFWSSDIPLPVVDRLEDYPRSLDEYLRLFQSAGDQHRVIGEASTTYFWSDVAIDRILEFAPDAKLVCMIRNPIELAHAMHSTDVFMLQEPEEDFEKAWRMGDLRRLSPDPIQRIRLDYRRIASVGQHLKRFMERVPEHQRQVIAYDDFSADTAACYHNLLGFLGLPVDARTDFPVINSSATHRFRTLARLLLQPPHWIEVAIRKARPLLRRSMLRMFRYKVISMLSIARRRASLRAEFRDELAREFHDEVMLVSELLKRDFSHWLKQEAPSAFAAQLRPASMEMSVR